MRPTITLKELKCPKCEDVFNYGSELKKHEKMCMVAPPGSLAPSPAPGPNPQPAPPTPVESSTLQETPATEVLLPATQDTIRALAIGEAILKAVPNADPSKAAQHVAYATSRKEALMKNEENKNALTPREQSITEVTNMRERLLAKAHRVANWSPALVANLQTAAKTLQACVLLLEGLSDEPNELKYLGLNASREPGVGDTVIVRKAFLDRFPVTKAELYGTTGGKVIEVEGEGKAKFLTIAFDNREVSMPLVQVKLKD